MTQTTQAVEAAVHQLMGHIEGACLIKDGQQTKLERLIVDLITASSAALASQQGEAAPVSETDMDEAYVALSTVLHVDHSHANKRAAIRKTLEHFAASRVPVASVAVTCEDCDGRGVQGEAIYQGDFQPPEHEPCESCGGSGKWMVPAPDIAILKEQLAACAASLRCYQEGDEAAAQRIEKLRSLLFHAHKLALRVRPAQGELCGTLRLAREAIATPNPATTQGPAAGVGVGS